mgnify:CR=1 FL=1
MKKYLLSILCGILLLPGCNYLDMVPEKDIETVESLFEQRTKVELWWKGLYAELNNIFAVFFGGASALPALRLLQLA